MITLDSLENILSECNKLVFAGDFTLVPRKRSRNPTLEYVDPQGIFCRVQTLYKELAQGVIQFELWISIGIPRMIELYHKVAHKDAKYFHLTTVLGNYLASIDAALASGNDTANFQRKVYTFNQPKQRDAIMRDLMRELDTTARYWFEHYDTVAAVDKLLNAAPEKPSAHVLMGDHRAIMGLIAAHLNDNKAYDELKAIYTKEIVEADGQPNPELSDVIAMLDGLRAKA